MKKFCLLLVILITAGSLPSYAIKEIVNDQTDRIVYSRSTKPDNSYVYSDAYYSNAGTGQIQYSKPELKAARYYQLQPVSYYQLKELGNNINPELVGTRWTYYYEEESSDRNMVPADTEKVNPELYHNHSSYVADESLKYNCREAADYFTRDHNNDPERLIPCGFDVEY